jgi:predicted transglutaminase-like cysteine proteinase
MLRNCVICLVAVWAAVTPASAGDRDKAIPLIAAEPTKSLFDPNRLETGRSTGMLLPARANPGPATSPPYGWVDFCDRYYGECLNEPLPAVDANLSVGMWRDVEQINKSINAAIEPVSDLDHWGIVDQWDYPADGKGDCEDYALLKRKLLIAAGVPRQALLMTVVRDENGDGHALLTLKTSRGDYVLDNKVDEVRLWSATGYQYIKRQSQEDPNAWVSLRGNDVPSVATTKKQK